MKALIRTSGALNLVFFAFHIVLGFWICRMPGIPVPVMAIMQMLNTALAGAFLYMGISMAFFAGEVAATRIGRLMLALGAITYLVRAGEELWLSPKPGPLVLGICIIAAVINLAALAKACPCKR